MLGSTDRPASTPPVAVVLMGVGGCGKSTVGRVLAARLGAGFTDADDLHPAQNVDKMRSGVPLGDEDRWPWLDLVGKHLRSAITTGTGIVVGCSALKRAYRDVLRVSPAITFLHLSCSSDVLRARLGARTGHFFGPSLLASQLGTLEPLQPDETGAVVDGDGPLEDVARAALMALARPDATGGLGPAVKGGPR